jgi:hypothetical protein
MVIQYIKSKKIFALTIALIFSFSFVFLSIAWASSNLVPNPSLENTSGLLPVSRVMMVLKLQKQKLLLIQMAMQNGILVRFPLLQARLIIFLIFIFQTH